MFETPPLACEWVRPPTLDSFSKGMILSPTQAAERCRHPFCVGPGLNENPTVSHPVHGQTGRPAVTHCRRKWCAGQGQNPKCSQAQGQTLQGSLACSPCGRAAGSSPPKPTKLALQRGFACLHSPRTTRWPAALSLTNLTPAPQDWNRSCSSVRGGLACFPACQAPWSGARVALEWQAGTVCASK